jgi:hypothetical protein
MKRIVFCLTLILILMLPAVAQDKLIRVVSGVRDYIETDEIIHTQANKRDKARAVLLAATVWAADYEGGDIYQSQVIKLSEVEEIHFYIDYTAVLKTKVRFYFIMTGPEIWSAEAPDPEFDDFEWYDATYTQYNYVGIITTTDWKKGTYTLLVFAEQQTEGSGAELAAKCIFRLK